jgi:hypothetical protein
MTVPSGQLAARVGPGPGPGRCAVTASHLRVRGGGGGGGRPPPPSGTPYVRAGPAHTCHSENLVACSGGLPGQGAGRDVRHQYCIHR